MLALLGLILPVAGAPAQTPGVFDFYLLSLSWSPSHCEAVGPANDPQQCQQRSLGFVVHGLWPEYESGYPDTCPSREPQPTSAEISAMLDVIPTSALIRHEWRTHGTCSGLAVRAYFDLVRAARVRVNVPPSLPVSRSGVIAPAAVEAAFVAANPGLSTRGMAVTCDEDRLAEVRICLTKSLAFRDCPAIDRSGCRASQVRVPQTSR